MQPPDRPEQACRWSYDEKASGTDFAIGNGSDSADGETEVTFRWRQQVTGAHGGGTLDNWANEGAIGICLVGGFSSDLPTPAPMRSLAQLAQSLQ